MKIEPIWTVQNKLRQTLCERRLLNVAEVLFHSHSNGPGLRSVIWVQGCSRRCPGCFNQDFIPFVQRRVVKPVDLLQLVIRQALGIEGITVTGGEPFDQVEGLAELLVEARRNDLSAVVYSGYYLEELLEWRNDAAAVALTNIDILIDGPYQPGSEPAPKRLGSANQQLRFLSDRYSPLDLEQAMSWPEEEIALLDGRQLVRTGLVQERIRLPVARGCRD